MKMAVVSLNSKYREKYESKLFRLGFKLSCVWHNNKKEQFVQYTLSNAPNTVRARIHSLLHYKIYSHEDKNAESNNAMFYLDIYSK